MNSNVKELQESVAKYKLLFNAMDEGYCIIQMLYDKQGRANDWRYLEVNPAFERHNGLKEATGKTIRELAPDIESKWMDIYNKVAMTGESIRFEEDSDALNRVFDLYAFRIDKPEERKVAVLFIDITKRKHSEKANRESESWLNGQKEAFQAAMIAQPLALSLEPLIRMVVEQTSGEARAAFYIVPPNDEGLHLVAGMTPEYAEEVKGFKIGPDSVACGLAMHKGEAVITSDTETDPIWKEWRHMARKFDYRGCCSFPARTVGGPALGTFAMYFTEPRNPTPRELEMAGIITHAAAIIISRHIQLLERSQAEDALRSSEKNLKELNEELESRVEQRTNELIQLKLEQEKEKLNAVIFAEEQERTRIGEGLHNGVAQLLYVVQNKLQLLDLDEGDSLQNLLSAEDILKDAINDVRKISFELMPPVLRDYGLKVAIQNLVHRIFTDGVKIKLHISLTARLPEALEISVYRLVQEMLNNVMKHSEASEASLELYKSGRNLILRVTDNGIGFSVKATEKLHKGLGLQAMQNRTRLLGGTIKFTSSKNRGTTVAVEIPLR